MRCLKKKKGHEKDGQNKIAPNNKLYLLLLVVAVALTVISLSVKKCGAAFTIWTSITCGCIASILVAWFIDAANCRQLIRKNKENREALFTNLYQVFDSGLQLLVFEAAEDGHNTDSRKWYEWIELADKQALANPDMLPASIRCRMAFFKDVAEQVFAIKRQEAMLLDAGIICQEDIQALSSILEICDLSRTSIRSKNSDEDRIRAFNTNCALIRGLIGFAPSLRPINELMIEPRLYQMYLEAQKEAHTPEISQERPAPNSEQARNET